MEPLSVVVATYNGSNRLPRLLRSLRSQDYDQSLVEIVIADDDSTDDSREIAQSYGAVVVRNGFRSGDTGKTIAIDAASHDLILVLDDDNYLPHDGWLTKLVQAYLSRPGAAGAQCAWFTYEPADSPFNRFCCLFGVRDPLVYYLGRQDHLRRTDTSWIFGGEVREVRDSHWVVHFEPHELPTVGAQGYLTRKSLLQRVGGWHPTYFHIDVNYELTKIGFKEFVIVKDTVGHEFGDSLIEMLIDTRKCTINLAHTQSTRSYRYETNLFRIGWAFLKMLTLVDPCSQALRMYFQTGDAAAFLHPAVSFGTAVMHLSVYPVEKLRALFAARRPVQRQQNG